MKILCVAPNPSGSGEAITAAAIACALEHEAHEVTAFAHPFAARFFGSVGRVETFADTPEDTGRRWRAILRELRPALVLFADYPLLPFTHHGRALVTDEARRALEDTQAVLVTLDHLGLAQGPLTISFGPPHLEPFPEHIAALPDAMRILLPCPVQSPLASTRRRGERCRYAPQIGPLASATRQAVRARFLRSSDERLVLHATPGWALAFCRRHALPYPRHLGQLLVQLLGGLAGPITVVCVNAGDELPAVSTAPNLRIVSIPPMPASTYDDLLLASDLVLTDNRISVGLGKGACGGVAGVALRNSFTLAEIAERGGASARFAMALDAERAGSVFPFEVFPIWSRADVDAMGLFDANPLTACVITTEMFGGDETRSVLSGVLFDAITQEPLRQAQAAYAASIRQLPAAHELLLG